MVGVGSVLGLGARARVKFFIFYFPCIGYAPYQSKKRKKQFGQNRVRARTPSPAPAFVFFSKDLSLWVLSAEVLWAVLSSHRLPQALLGCSEFPGDVLALLGCSECPGLQDGLMRTVGVGREDPQPIMLFRFPPWGGRPSRFRVRARGRIFYLYFDAIPYHRQKKKVVTGKSGARADPNQNITAHSP